jgi:hypothetical protein
MTVKPLIRRHDTVLGTHSLHGKARLVSGLRDRASGTGGKTSSDANEDHGPRGTGWPSTTGAVAKPAQGVDPA